MQVDQPWMLAGIKSEDGLTYNWRCLTAVKLDIASSDKLHDIIISVRSYKYF